MSNSNVIPFPVPMPKDRIVIYAVQDPDTDNFYYHLQGTREDMVGLMLKVARIIGREDGTET